MTTTERDEGIVPAGTMFAADSLADALGGAWWDDEVMLGGWTVGSRAYSERAPLPDLVTRLASLENRALGLALERTGAGDAIGRAEALDALLRVRDAATLLHEAAVQGFSHSALRALEAHAREVRHELKNPIGTIRNAVAMLQEGSVSRSDEVDAHPGRLHAIAVRGAAQLETLVRERLTGAAMRDVLLGSGTPFGDVIAALIDALAPRARGAGVTLVAAPSVHEIAFRCRRPGVDLVIRSMSVAAVRAADSGSRVLVDLLDTADGGRRVRVRPEQPSHAATDLLDGAHELAGRVGLSLAGRLDAGGVYVELGPDEGSGRQ